MSKLFKLNNVESFVVQVREALVGFYGEENIEFKVDNATYLTIVIPSLTERPIAFAEARSIYTGKGWTSGNFPNDRTTLINGSAPAVATLILNDSYIVLSLYGISNYGGYMVFGKLSNGTAIAFSEAESSGVTNRTNVNLDNFLEVRCSRLNEPFTNDEQEIFKLRPVFITENKAEINADGSIAFFENYWASSFTNETSAPIETAGGVFFLTDLNDSNQYRTRTSIFIEATE